MLLKPSAFMHETAINEVTAERHPERIAGNGPEQDYLSRLYAPYWSHIATSYNFQLHHVFYSLEALLQIVRYVPPSLKSPIDKPQHGELRVDGAVGCSD